MTILRNKVSSNLRVNGLSRLVYVSLVLAGSALWMMDAQQTEESNFQGGKVTRDQMPKVRSARLHFDPGAHTKWHSHEKGQILLCEDGVARTQVMGQKVKELHPGETTYVPGGVPHWHGAAPDHSVTLFSVDVSDGQTKWLGEVSQKEYETKPSR